MSKNEKRPPTARHDPYVDEHGITHVPLSEAEVERAIARWREVFAAEVLRRTGQPVLDRFEWHAFSGGFTPALEGDEAIATYRSQTPREVLVLAADTDPRMGGGTGYRCHGPRLPEFTGLDFLVVRPDFACTMAFTHEMPTRPRDRVVRAGGRSVPGGFFGPYFAFAPQRKSRSRP